MTEVNTWTIQRLIQWTTQHFSTKGIESSRLDAELLLCHTLKCPRLDLYLKFDQPLKDEELRAFRQFIVRRAQREPVAYIIGAREFYGRTFNVKPGVLIPRPETEHLVDEAKCWLGQHDGQSPIEILDVGSGSGAIGVTLACERPKTQATCLDASPLACEISEQNSRALRVGDHVKVVQSDFLNWDTDLKFDIVVSNPPYISKNEASSLSPDVFNFEPHEALFGGEQGDEILKAWIPKMISLLKKEGLLLCEIGYDQEEKIKNFAQHLRAFKEIAVLKDYGGRARVFKGIING